MCVFALNTEINMLAVALKGVFLIGVISWYSMAIMSMINDYFRAEFNDYLKKNPITSHKADQELPAIVIKTQTPFNENEKPFESIDNTNNEKRTTETNEIFQWNKCERNGENTGTNRKMHCERRNRKEEILLRLFGNSHHSCDMCAIDSVNGNLLPLDVT